MRCQCAIKLACTSAASAGIAANDAAAASVRRGRQPFDRLPNCNWNAKVLRVRRPTLVWELLLLRGNLLNKP